MQKNQIYQVLKKYLSCWKKLKKAGIIRSNNLTADIGEYFVCEKLKLKQVKQGNMGFDAKNKYGKKYEIKTRKASTKNAENLVFPIYNESPYLFDYLVLANLDYYFRIERLIIIPKRLIRKYKKKYRIYISNKLIEERGVKVKYYGKNWIWI